jgi:WD40 repeat protein/serine/threonine protein kinase
MRSAERYRQAKRLFLEASALPRRDRTKFLAAQCATDAEMEAQVRRLLTADDRDGDFLERSPMDGPGLNIGAKLGPFRIVRLLGEGGMGVVYEAECDEPSRRVALKLIRQGDFSERLRSRFRHEIRVLGQLRHPGVAQIYEAGTLEHGGQRLPYFSMELVEGEPLLQCARERELGVRERLALIAQICDAVHHAHQKGVIHRDLKPGNILVEAAPTTDTSGDSATALPLQVKVLDFGVARIMDTTVATATLTHSGQMIGTLAYMSPEQVAGDPGALDTRSDVYAIGVIASELLTGRLPYKVEGASMLEAARIIREEEPSRLGAADRSLRGDIETIVARALQKDPGERYQSAAEFAADIRRHLRDEPILARPPSSLYQLRKFARRHKPLVTAATLALLAMIAATLISAWQARVAVHARDLAEAQRERADVSAQAALREARRAIFAGASAALESGDPITARRLLEAAEGGAEEWPWRYWHAQLDQSVAMVRPPGPIAGAWLSPNAAEVVIVGVDGSVRRGSPWGGELPVVARLAKTPVPLAVVTADGRRIIATCGEARKGLDVFDASDGRLLEHAADPGYRVGLLDASADGRVIAAGLKRISGAPPADDLWVWRATAEGWEGRQIREGGRSYGLTMSADGRRLASGYDGVSTWDTATALQRTLVTLQRGGLRFAVSDDGAVVAGGGEDGAITVWNSATGALLATLSGHAGAITALALDPAGRTLASAGTDLTVRLWDVASGEPIATLAGHTGRIERLQFAAERSQLVSVSTDGSVRLWQREPEEAVNVLRGHESYVYAVAFTHDGQRVVSGAWDETVRVWDAAGGRELSVLLPDREEPLEKATPAEIGGGVFEPAPPGFVAALALSPDGRWLVTGHRITEWGPGHVRVFDTRTGRQAFDLGAGQGGVCDVLFSRDGKRLWVAWDHHGVEVFNLAERPLDGPAPPQGAWIVRREEPRALALSPDGREFACTHVSGMITVRDAETGEVLQRLEGHTGWAASLAYHPSLRLLASASVDGSARLWNLDTGEGQALRGHWDRVYALAFSPDGSLLATGSQDTTIILWDVASGQQLTQLRGHSAYIYHLAFSPDGSRLASASGDSTVRIWDTRPLHERWRAWRGAGRESDVRQHNGAEAPTAASPDSSDR